MKYARAFSVLITLAGLIGIAKPATAAATYANFSIAGAKVIYPSAVNNTGQACGEYEDSSGVYHGFLFQPNGTITTFDVPNGSYTTPLSINGLGQIVGYYYDSKSIPHGFLRNLAGEFTTLNAPDAYKGTTPTSINDAGEIAGGYFDASDAAYGFVRDVSGTYTTFSVPNATQIAGALLNQSGQIAGTYVSTEAVGGDICYCEHGYTMDTLGNITTFDGPGAVATYVAGVNAGGQITGQYTLSIINLAWQTYFRDASGDITTFSVADWYSTAGIEDNGNVVGAYLTQGTYYGWQRNSVGEITFFKDPNAGNKGTLPTCVSGNGKVAGYYIDSGKVVHGFVQH
jgi:ABC-type amino acid transport substrate-binding protein